jgi:hypothetical protein
MYSISMFHEDLKIFQSLIQGELFPNYIEEGATQDLYKKMKNSLKDNDRTDYFFIYAYTEALLQTGIHSYDPDNFSEYIKKVRFPIHIRKYGELGNVSSKPQALLNGITHWSKNLERLRECLETYLPLWVNEYDSAFQTKMGKTILKSLSLDKEVYADHNEKNQKPLTIVKEVLTSLSRGRSEK